MWAFVIVVISCILLGISAGEFWYRYRKPKLDGHLVITEDDGKTLMSFEFDDEDQIVQLRNKQVVSFKVVGPDHLTIEQDS